jgi:hypothetical protein
LKISYIDQANFIANIAIKFSGSSPMSGDRMSQLALTNNNNKSRLIFGIMKIDVII